jgi:hypothetical protein
VVWWAKNQGVEQQANWSDRANGFNKKSSQLEKDFFPASGLKMGI